MHRFLIEYETPPFPFEDINGIVYGECWRKIRGILKFCKKNKLKYTLKVYR